MEKNQDRRIRKTKLALKDGLLELMSKKNLKEISIRELTEKVDLNRGTFYLHYKDIFDLLEEIEEESFAEFRKIVNSYPTGSLNGDPFPLLKDIFTFLKENATMVTVMLGSTGDPAFVNRLKKLIWESCFEHWQFPLNKNKTKELQYFYNYTLGGCIGIIETWLQNDLKDTPEELAGLAKNIIMNGVAVLK